MRSHVFLICAAACWCGAIVAAPAASSAGGMTGFAAHAVYAFFSTICHQWDSHSFHLFGHKLPVCIRCFAIYFSFFAGILLYPALGSILERRFTSRTILIAASAGMILDAGCSMLGIWQSSTATRLVTGGTFGLLAAVVLTPVLVELLRSLRHAGIFSS